MIFSIERLLLLQRLYRLLTRTALALGDMTLIESACLALAAQQEEGATAAEAAAILRIERAQLNGAVALLEDREQVRWERSSRDRRTFAFRITAKGAEAAAFLDEALAIALINRSRFLTEEGFDRLVGLLHQCFADAEPDGEAYLLPAAALGALGAFGAALAQAGAQRGMPSGQVMTLALLKRAGGPVNVAPLAAALDLSLPAVRLQIEGLVEKGLAKPGSSPNEVLLEPSGAQRLEAVLAHEAVGRVRAASAASWARDASRAEAFDELMSLLDYVLDGQAEEAPSVAATPLGATASNRPSALAALYALLARLFSYPERRQAEDHTSIELLRQVRELLEGLGPREGLPVDVAVRFEAWAAKSPTARGRDLRAEFTRLFYGYPRLRRGRRRQRPRVGAAAPRFLRPPLRRARERRRPGHHAAQRQRLPRPVRVASRPRRRRSRLGRGRFPSERRLDSGDGEFRVLPPALILTSSWPIGLSF